MISKISECNTPLKRRWQSQDWGPCECRFPGLVKGKGRDGGVACLSLESRDAANDPAIEGQDGDGTRQNEDYVPLIVAC
jgi:hypothetical protein